jgi:hypothetical protein
MHSIAALTRISSSSAQGLVYNWGCALSSYASHMPGLDAAAKAAALEQAASKLRSAAEFSAGDVAPLNALGVFSAVW